MYKEVRGIFWDAACAKKGGVGNRVACEDKVKPTYRKAGNDGKPSQSFSQLSPNGTIGRDERKFQAMPYHSFKNQQGNAQDEQCQAVGDKEGATAIFVHMGTKAED